MSPRGVECPPLGKTSRRRFLKGAAALGVAAPAFASAPQSHSDSAHHPIFAYVGSYSLPQGPDGSIGRGQGIYVFEMNPATGALVEREVIRRDTNPSFMAFDSSRQHLYSVNWISNYQGQNSGSVSAYTIDRASGHLTLLNTVSSEGANPTHLSIHPSGKYVLVASYFGGTVAVLPILASGELGPATDVVHDQGTVGPQHAASAPPGSFAISGHDKPHAHMVQSDPAGRFVLAADLGLDRILIWKFDAEKGRLIPNDPPSAALPAGDGPRHFAFHPSGHWFYSLQEEGSTVAVYDYDSAQGRLTAKQTVSSLPKGFAGSNFPAEVMISADGKFLYASNRLHDSIAWFSISATGTLAWGGEEWTRGDHPRAFNFDPSGDFFYVCNQFADALTTFRIDRRTGALTFTGQYTPVGSPASIIFLA
ncbi:MAG TPA: lactonase family protein [Terriglobia bacterium]|nr:lactonase family protein [Terriglobia bacterium]